MLSGPILYRGLWSALACVAATCCAPDLAGQTVASSAPTLPGIQIIDLKGRVDIQHAGQTRAAATNDLLLPGDRLETGPDSRVTLLWYDRTPFQISARTRIEIPPPRGVRRRSGLNLLQGLIYFFHRDKAQELELRSPTALAVVLGTEFTFQVEPDGRTVLTLFDGEVELSAGSQPLRLKSGEQGVVEAGQPPRRTAIVRAVNDLIQWFLYYPAVLNTEELALTEPERAALSESLAAYHVGDLPEALQKYPVGRQPSSNAEKIYRASLVLTVGQVDEAERLLRELTAAAERPALLSAALHKLISAVKGRTNLSTLNPQLSTTLLAESYYQQSRANLAEARRAATNAVRRSPQFGVAWARVAELEFSFGRTRQAREAADRALALSPRHAPALALKGFLLAAENKFAQALTFFDQAIAADGALGNAWLGRGLCRIHQGRLEEGRQDLLVAAALEPQRSLLRSYLGKAFSDAGDYARARHEIELARQLDRNDPTAPLYAALLKQQDNQINDAVRDLERSVDLNENRQVYRSRLLLDQDRAVRGANLANVYQDAGMTEVSVREAVRAVNTDYLNYSAHLFLANSFDRLRDPRQINLRYETPWLTEYLLANLLAPVGAGTLSQTVSQQEYARLFERNRHGLVSSTEYRSSGDWFQTASQFGTWDNFSYALDAAYRSENGHRPNNDFEQLTLSLQLKQQLTPQDGLFFQSIYYDAEAGDVRQYYDGGQANRGLRVMESQEPLLLLGYHHEWTSDSHTLVLAGRLQDTFSVTNPAQPVLLLGLDDFGRTVIGLPYPALPMARLNYRSEFEAYTAEAQHLLRVGPQSFIVGARFQTGTFDTRDQLGSTVATGFAGQDFTNVQPFEVAGVAREFTADVQRLSAYAYDQWQVAEPLLLSAGLSYDRLTAPLNFRAPPTSPGERTIDLLSPKAGLIWTPWKGGTVRAGYARALGGASFDQSFRLEPSQVAGFNQAFRSVAPEAVAGSVAGEELDICGASLEQKFATGTYLGAQAELLNSKATREVGALDNRRVPLFFDQPTTTTERVRYRERTLTFTANQLLARDWSMGARYRISDAELDRRLTDILDTVGPRAQREEMATLQQASFFALFNHPAGFFSQFDAVWSHQSNRGAAADLPGDDFWQFNIFGGYRFAHRHAEVRLGLLNFTDQDYRLYPLNLYAELPHERTVTMSLRFNF